MSGIAGIIHFDGQPARPSEVQAMTTAMAYRGPDGIAHWSRESAALGHCMLRTTPESLDEQQPLTNENDSLVLVLDGRIDNWEGLRRDLLGRSVNLRNRSDAELVLRAYETWGTQCLSHIEGDFAFVIWDVRQQQAFCARDRAGSRRFLYHWNGRSLAFATDVHAILSLPWVPHEPNLGALAQLLALLGWESDETLWKDITRLAPAHHLMVRRGCTGTAARYWYPDIHARLPCRSDGDYKAYYLDLFTDVVRRMSRSHHPIACDVSGGLDSSAIFAVAEHLRRTGRLLAPGLEGYALDFSGDPRADEMAYARAVGAHLGRSIHEIPPAFISLDAHRSHARRLHELPEFPATSMNRSIASAAHSHGCRVWLRGQGGDEWIGGVAAHSDALASLDFAGLYKLLRADAQAGGIRSALRNFVRHGLMPFLPARALNGVRALAGRPPAPVKPAPFWLSLQMSALLQGRPRPPDVVPRLPGARHAKRRLLDFLTGDKSVHHEFNELQSALLGLETRRPFWDSRLIQATISMPEHLRLRGNENKWLHRQALAGLLPGSVLHRTDKAEFSAMHSHYQRQLEPLILDLLPRRHDWINAAKISALVQGVPTPASPALTAYRKNLLLWMLFCADAAAD